MAFVKMLQCSNYQIEMPGVVELNLNSGVIRVTRLKKWLLQGKRPSAAFDALLVIGRVILVAHNKADFRGYPGLVVGNWAQAA